MIDVGIEPVSWLDLKSIFVDEVVNMEAGMVPVRLLKDRYTLPRFCENSGIVPVRLYDQAIKISIGCDIEVYMVPLKKLNRKFRCETDSRLPGIVPITRLEDK